jgi:hypothetical protein
LLLSLRLNRLLEEPNEFPNVQIVTVEHLEQLTLHVESYFPQSVIKHSWVCSAFDTDVEDLADNMSSIAALQEHLIEILNDKTLRYNFQKQTNIIT